MKKKSKVQRTKVKKAVKKVQKSSKKKTPIKRSSVGVMPLGDRILLKALSADDLATVTSFGIVIPDSSKEKPEQGTVIAVGPGKRGENGEIVEPTVKVGDRVMFSKYGFDEIKIKGVEYLILPESSILAILDN